MTTFIIIAYKITNDKNNKIMAKIGVSLNEVLRDYVGQLAYTYDKYIGENSVTEEDITNFNLIEFFKFDDINKFNTFLYLEAPLEIFGHADQMSDGLMNRFNTFLMDIKDDGEHEIEIVSREIDKSIPSTYFFLSKTSCRIDKVRFVQDYASKWDGLDVLITANPQALEAKPSGKISVKVNTTYNKNVAADFEIDSILDFIKNEDLRTKILNTKITTYEDI
jgi:5'(3')-deoxyribonucleotidase